MTPEEKTAWTTALRSGEYKQATGVLRRELYGGGYGHCCLGVKCDLEPDGEFTQYGDYRVSHSSLGLGVGLLPEIVAERLGITVDGQFEVPGGIQVPVPREDGKLSLTELNDDGWTFDQIADVIDYFF